MGSILFRLLALILILWLVRRILGSFLSSPRQPDTREKPTGVPNNNMVKDPVCGMYMDSRLAVRLEKRKETHYFCSEECKNKYLGISKKGEAHTAPPM
jgi:uncharacterized protein